MVKPSRLANLFLAALSSGALLLAGCHPGPRPRSEHSFDQIAARVTGMSAAEVATLLGEPDSRQPVFLRDERWIWWNYTFLDGEDYPPEIRGRVVHLEITFRNPAAPGTPVPPYSEWRIARPFGVAYRAPWTASATAAPAAATAPGR